MNLGWAVPITGRRPCAHRAKRLGHRTGERRPADVQLLLLQQGDDLLQSERHSWVAIAWPYPDSMAYVLRSNAVSIPLSQVETGTNTIRFMSSGGAIIANVDLVMQGAGGVVSATS